MDCINHILLEAYCLKDRCGSEEAYPPFCPTKGRMATYQCLLHQCQYVDFTSCENTLCYIGEHSDEEYGISFGGEMEDGQFPEGVEAWKRIAIAKIDEAYDAYMEKARGNHG